jgi:hypothetical protein
MKAVTRMRRKIPSSNAQDDFIVSRSAGADAGCPCSLKTEWLQFYRRSGTKRQAEDAKIRGMARNGKNR